MSSSEFCVDPSLAEGPVTMEETRVKRSGAIGVDAKGMVLLVEVKVCGASATVGPVTTEFTRVVSQREVVAASPLVVALNRLTGRGSAASQLASTWVGGTVLDVKPMPFSTSGRLTSNRPSGAATVAPLTSTVVSSAFDPVTMTCRVTCDGRRRREHQVAGRQGDAIGDTGRQGQRVRRGDRVTERAVGVAHPVEGVHGDVDDERVVQHRWWRRRARGRSQCCSRGECGDLPDLRPHVVPPGTLYEPTTLGGWRVPVQRIPLRAPEVAVRNEERLRGPEPTTGQGEIVF